MRTGLAIFLILAAIGIYYGYTQKVFADIKNIKSEIADYDATLAKADELDSQLEQFNRTKDAFGAEDIGRLEKLLPNGADNVRLLIDIQSIASSTKIEGNKGMEIKDISINDENKQGTQAPSSNQAFGGDSGEKYSSVTLSFSTSAPYDKFKEFLSKLEQSLRLVDITTLTISPDASSAATYNYKISLKAYWLK